MEPRLDLASAFCHYELKTGIFAALALASELDALCGANVYPTLYFKVWKSTNRETGEE